MWQDILITDLTQMGGEHLCMAGMARDWSVVRPVPAEGYLTARHLIHPTFVVRPGSVVSLFCRSRKSTTPPHVEDVRWDMDNGLKFVRQLEADSWWHVLERLASPSVEAIFETRFARNKHILPDQAARSLGTLKPTALTGLEFRAVPRDDRSTLYLDFIDGDGEQYAKIPVNDLTLRAYVLAEIRAGKTPQAICAALLSAWEGRTIWLRLGLTRPWEGRCWLQVNGIYTAPDYLNGRCFADFDPMAASPELRRQERP